MSVSQSILSTPIKIGNMVVPNRIMRSAVWMAACDVDGYPPQALLEYYRELARGKTGLIVPGYVYPIKSGKANPGQGGMWSDRHAESWRSTIKDVHGLGSKIIFQVCDSGVTTTFDNVKEMPRGVSALLPGQREMTTIEIDEVIESFKNCAKRLEEVGADGMQIHGAHGYLVSAFLTPLMNKRTDQYGGALENRVRFLQEICKEIRSVTSPSFNLSMKINGDDCKENGLTADVVGDIISRFKSIDLFEISCGLADAQVTVRMKSKDKQTIGYPLTEGYNFRYAEIIKKVAPKQSLAVVGGYRNLSEVEKVLKTGVVDLVSFGRPSLADPHFAQKLLNGQKKVRCISCGLCILKSLEGPVKCWI